MCDYTIEECEAIMEACVIRLKEIRRQCELKEIWMDKYDLAKALKEELKKNK